MINQLLIWVLLVPILGAVSMWYFLHRTASAGAEKLWLPPVISVVIASILLVVVFFGSRSAATSDIEIWNGQVVSKNRKHDEYQRSYDCNCKRVESCSGTGKNRTCTSREVCDTCYEDRYTVKWTIDTTVGKFTIDELDRSTPLVYASPDPKFYADAQPGDPASRRNTYTNYVQAVPESLFATPPSELRQRFAGLLPQYPDAIHSFYKNNHFLSPGFSVADAAEWDRQIGLLLRERGPRKQVNAIVVLAKTDDPLYADALRYAWDGVNKNDVVLVVGSKQWPQIDFVRVISWTKNELFKIELTNAIKEQGIINREQLLTALGNQIDKNFERRRMREFEYLQAEIDPPTWLILVSLAIILAGQAGLTYFLWKDLAQRATRNAGRRRYK